MTIGLPATMDVRTLLSDLLGRDVTLTTTSPFDADTGRPTTFAVYVDDSLIVRAVIAVDLPLSAHIGSSIGLIPVFGAEDAIETGRLPGAMAENLYEVLNIAASLFNVPGAPHVRLYAVHEAGVAAPQDVQARAMVLGQREDLEIAIAGYGSGQLSIVLS